LLFGIGLILSGMSDPSKVLGFLDLAGDWDPSLALVLGGAVLVGAMAFPFASKRSKSILGEVMHLPTATQIDRRLVFGSVTFGVGWGLAGYCPGPALASLAQGGLKPLLFVVAMLLGMGLFEMLERMKAKNI
jgi:uncharacterized membrane protein YedE/YeeE